MRIPSRCPTPLERALARAGSEADFRAQVLEEGREVTAAYRLSAAEWHWLCAEVERLEADAAGRKANAGTPHRARRGAPQEPAREGAPCLGP